MVTIKDIAAKMHTSTSTVSLVLNHRYDKRVRPDLARDILRTAEEMGYHYNELAASLRKGATHTIAFISDQVATTPYAGEIIHGAQDAARQLGYMMFIIDADGKRNLEQDLSHMLGWGVGGYIYAKFANRLVSVPHALNDRPVVVVNATERNGAHPSIAPDEVGIGYSATKYLLDAGCRRIAYIGVGVGTLAQTGRMTGYKNALHDAGIPFDNRLIVRVSQGTPAFGAVERLLDETKPDGVFAFNDARAVYVYDYAFKHGLTIGSDLSVIGVDNYEVICDTTVPALTSVELPHYEMGFWGACKVISMIEGGDPITENRATPAYHAVTIPTVSGDKSPALIPCAIIAKQSVVGEVS